jgi:hypothetical protein
MKRRESNHRGFFVLAIVTAGLLGWPARAVAQTTGGEARAVQATVLGATTVLSDTGVLSAGSSDALDASSPTGSVPSLLTSDTLHAATVGSPDEIDSEASLGSLAMSLFGNTLSVDFVMARAMAVTGAAGAATSEVDGLTINGVSIPVSGAPNQTVPIAGGMVILNEQQTGSAGAVANALHVIVTGLADVVVASATAGTPPSSSSTPPLPLPGL